VEIMRRDHFEFITHQRDLTVHQGIRTKIDCFSCHATVPTSKISQSP
jgi:hypothetical protein